MSLIKEFRTFLTTGGAADISAGVVVGVVIGHTVESIIENMLIPIASVSFSAIPINQMHFVLKEGSPRGPYASLDDAAAAGAVTLNYGQVTTNVISLFIVILFIFLSVRVLNRLREERIDHLLGLDKIRTALAKQHKETE